MQNIIFYLALNNQKPNPMATNEVQKILSEFGKLETKLSKRFDSIDVDLKAIKDDIRKISKFVPIDNADFNGRIKQTNGVKAK